MEEFPPHMVRLHERSSTTLLTDLQESADGLFVTGSHGDHILIEPEEGPVLPGDRLGVHHQTKEFEEQPTCTLWRGRVG